jgi:hypothetical protein
MTAEQSYSIARSRVLVEFNHWNRLTAHSMCPLEDMLPYLSPNFWVVSSILFLRSPLEWAPYPGLAGLAYLPLASGFHDNPVNRQAAAVFLEEYWYDIVKGQRASLPKLDRV